MLKISQIQPPNHAITLRLEGRLVGPWVAEARSTCEQLLEEGRFLKLELAELEFLDGSGVVLLLDLRRRGVSLANHSPFIEEQLRQATAG